MLFTGLKDVLKTFDEHGWKGSFTRGLWEIGNGGYDCWFELYYKGLPVARCIDGELESNSPWVNDVEKEKIFNKILEVYDHLKDPDKKLALDNVINVCEESSNKRLFLDMDGTLARFHDVDKTFIEAMWQPGFYVGLKPFENMVEGIKLFIKEHPEMDVYILSAVLDTEPPFVIEEKNAWVDKYLPEIDWKNRLFTKAGENKAEALGGIGPNDYLLDDYNKNLHEFAATGAHSIKFRNDVNHQGKGAYGGEIGPLWDGDMLSYDSSPKEIAHSLAVILGLEQERCESLNDKIANASKELEHRELSAPPIDSIIKDKTAPEL